MSAPLKILAVDDEPAIAQSMRFIFPGPLFQLASVLDGEAALTKMENEPEPFDVIITDNNMPGVTGVELVRLLRERKFPGKIMVLSAHLSAELRAAYDQLEVDAMVDKPFSVQTLRSKIQQLAA